VSAVPDDPTPFPPFGVRKREHVYESPWCSLRRDEVILPNGQDQEYHVFEIGPAAVVVPVLPGGDIVLIGQYRYPHGKTSWELPAGRLNEGEDPLAGAQRELLEETGYRSDECEPLMGFYPIPGISAHYGHAIVARNCAWVREPEHEAAEQIVVRRFTQDEVEALLDGGRLEDAFTALPLLTYLRGLSTGI